MDSPQFIEDPTNGSITFIQNKVPRLLDGDYQFSSELKIEAGESSESQTSHFNFSVSGPRFSLAPDEIQGVFPAPNSTGDFSEVLPHVLLKRASLPWERSPIYQKQTFEPSAGKMPWLGLLMIDQEEMDEYEVVTQNVEISSLDKTIFPIEKGDDAISMVNMITIPDALISKIYPRPNDLSLTTHIRRSFDDMGNELSETAVLVANRLPRPGAHISMFLVSFEGAYTDTGEFLAIGLGSSATLPVLYSWSFQVEEEAEGTAFANSLSQLESTELIKDLGENPASDYTNEAGFLVLPHQLRNGEATASFYRGPLAVPQGTLQFQLPVLSADSLLAYDASLGMFVAAYAAAWELGRLLALEQKTFSQQLYQWKRKQTLLTKSATQALEKAHLPIYGQSKRWNRLNEEQFAFFRLNTTTESNLAGGSQLLQKNGTLHFNHSNQFGDCIDFDGESTYINADSLTPALNADAAISFWLRVQHFEQPPLDGGACLMRFILSYTSSANDGLKMSLVLDGQQLRLWTFYGLFDLEGTLTDTEWHHIVIQNKFDTNELTVIVSVDGEEKLTHTIDHDIVTPDYDKFRLGYEDENGGEGYFFGNMANLRIYPRLLTPDELSLVHDADSQGAQIYPFLNQLRVLKGVPFNYLIPDEAQFPREHIAFSKVDTTWLKCLLDGAFSIGRSSSARLAEDQLILQEMGVNTEGEYSTMMIRSASLKSWPDVVVEGYDHLVTDTSQIATGRLRIMRKVMLSDNFLFCLFEGVVKTVDISQKPTTLHFGVQKNQQSDYDVSLRNKSGDATGTSNVTFYDDGDYRVINCADTASDINTELGEVFDKMTSAQFAFELIEGVQRVRFTNQNTQ